MCDHIAVLFSVLLLVLPIIAVDFFISAYGLHNSMQKALRETQTLRAACSKAEPKNFAPPQTPFPEARDGQNLMSWRWSLPLPRIPVWWGSMYAISSYHGNRPTLKQTGPITIHCAAASAQCNKFESSGVTCGKKTNMFKRKNYKIEIRSLHGVFVSNDRTFCRPPYIRIGFYFQYSMYTYTCFSALTWLAGRH